MDNKEEKIENIEKNVLDKIKSMNIKMKPRAYFVAQALLLLLGVIAIFLFAVYLVSFIAFSLRASGLLFLPKFGMLGFKMLIGPLPWLLIILSLGLVFLLEVLAKHFSFVYRRSVVYSLVIIITVVVFCGLILESTPFHPFLFRSAQDRQLPVVGSFYRGFGAPVIKGVYHGIVSEITSEGFIIETPNNNKLFLAVSSNILKGKEIEEGDVIIAIGEKRGKIVQVSNIHKVDEDDNIFPKRPRPNMK